MNETGPSAPRMPSRFSWEWLSNAHHKSLLHPTTAVWILGLDWLIFGGNALSLGLATFLLMFFGFLLGTLGSVLCQSHFSQDPPAAALVKGLLGGLLVGIPLPVAGTFAAAVILTISGLEDSKNKLPFKQ